MQKNLFAFSLMILALLLLSCGSNPEKLRIGIIKASIDHLPLSYAYDNGLLDKKQYELLSFSSGWELQEALIAGHADAAIMPFTYAWNAAAKGYPIRIVSFFERETDGILSQPEIKSIQDLHHKKIGLLKASTLDILMQDLAKRSNITYEAVYFRTPNESISALQSRAVDAIVLYVPLIQKLWTDYHVLHWFKDDYAAHPCCDLCVNTKQMTVSKQEMLKKLLRISQSQIELIERRDPKIISYVERNYGLSKSMANNTLDYTIFQTGLDTAGKAFERQMISIAIEAGYQEKDLQDAEIYLELF